MLTCEDIEAIFEALRVGAVAQALLEHPEFEKHMDECRDRCSIDRPTTDDVERLMERVRSAWRERHER